MKREVKLIEVTDLLTDYKALFAIKLSAFFSICHYETIDLKVELVFASTLLTKPEIIYSHEKKFMDSRSNYFSNWN